MPESGKNPKRKLVVLSGAGISAESGLKTFRDSGGLWEGHRVEEVATPEAWAMNPKLVLKFYNERRRQLFEVDPNAGHLALVELENQFDVTIITQNVDNLHERAGSSDVLHLHGELDFARSSKDPELVYELKGKDIELGDQCELGSQLRPHIVWFGESVPAITRAAEIAESADILIVVGTSLAVYPAASLAFLGTGEMARYVVNLEVPDEEMFDDFEIIEGKASEVLPELVERLLSS